MIRDKGVDGDAVKVKSSPTFGTDQVKDLFWNLLIYHQTYTKPKQCMNLAYGLISMWILLALNGAAGRALQDL